MDTIPQGYKDSKLGIIPEDWEVVKLGKLLIEKPKYGIGASAVEFSNDLPTYLRITDIDENGLFHPEKKASLDDKEYVNYILQDNELVFARTGATVGKSYLYNKKDGELVYAGFLIKVSPDNEKLNSKYLKKFVETHTYWHWVQIMSARSGQPGINGEEYATMPIPLPTLEEQTKIAEILTTWDNAIEKQESLIQEKKQLKKGLMQRLLSGEKRFDGFDDEWQETKLGKYIKEISKKNNKNINLVLSVTNKHGFITQKDYFAKEVASKDTSNYKIVERYNFAYNPSRINVGSIALLEKFEIGILSPMYVIFECLDGLNRYYLNYWLKSHDFNGNLYKYLSGSVRDSLAFKDMSLIKIKLPSTEEQDRIVETLKCVDDEIILLNKELDELKLQKKGLMQNLLTGKVRVKV